MSSRPVNPSLETIRPESALSHMKPPSPTLVSEAFPRTGSSLYYALAAAPTAHRRVLSLWLQWWHQTAQIPLIISDPGVAETKLRWWQQEVNKASQGQASHPVLKELMEASAASQACQLPAWSNWQSQLDELITLIHQTRWLDEASLIRHAQRSTGLRVKALRSFWDSMTRRHCLWRGKLDAA